MKLAVINVEEGLKRVMNNKALFRRLLGNFSGQSMILQITEAVEKGDHTELSKAAHALKGVAGNLSMHQLADIAGRIDECAREEKNASALLPELNSAMLAVDEEIARLVNDAEA